MIDEPTFPLIPPWRPAAHARTPSVAERPDPGGAEPGGAEPGSAVPGGAVLDSGELDSDGPGSGGQRSAGPGSTGPGSTGPGSTGPGSTGPGSTEPGSAGRRMRLVAEFGLFASGCDDVQRLLDEACRVAAEGLESRFTKLLAYQPGEGCFVLRAGTGWRDGLVGHARLHADVGTAAGFAWRTGQSVVSNDIVAGGRFRVPGILTDHGIGSSVNVVVPGSGVEDEDAEDDAEDGDAQDGDAQDGDAQDGGAENGDAQDGALPGGLPGALPGGGGGGGLAFGVLEVEAPGRGDFTTDDVCFLQVVANSLAAALARGRARARREAGARRRALAHQLALREVHHRVRNDLQGICSSLDREARRAEAGHREGLGRISARVFALVELYDHLLGAGVADRVEFGVYLRALCARIAAAGALADRSIALRVEAQPMMMPCERVLPLAVALNELVSNSVEHAFAGRPGAGGGTILVSLRAEEPGGVAVLSVGDDRRGFGGPGTGGVGLDFVERFVRQAGGTLARGEGGGTLWRITLPPRRAAGRAGAG